MLVGCRLLTPAAPTERWTAELAETSVTAFLLARSDPQLPAAPLAAQGTGVYGALVDDAGGTRIWQVRQVSADVVALPISAAERAADVQFKADVVMLFEQRYCTVARATGTWRCEPWQAVRCCEQVWRLTPDGWISERPPVRQ